jgi:serine/threonine protein kinase
MRRERAIKRRQFRSSTRAHSKPLRVCSLEVHRDIKPANIMVKLKEERGVTAKIIDLGLAKTLDESASEAGISSPGAFVGTPEFASPEQFTP